ncbi:2-oxoadipate dehydrogenase complex component E1-like [Oscarella lobularis]|uniref:2-oxoadipate dehydrogenase complex component E1-like n=1 Tax=Oscarella lobularis TaxID=121494 RepID=UPI003314201E
MFCARLLPSSRLIWGRVRRKGEIKLRRLSTEQEDRHLKELVACYRHNGHAKAKIDPLDLSYRSSREIDDAVEKVKSLSSAGSFRGLVHNDGLKNLDELVDYLEHVYCNRLGLEIHQLSSEEEKSWLIREFEESATKFQLSSNERKRMAEQLIKSQAFDTFLGKKFGHIKRYSAEGAESLLSFMSAAVNYAAKDGVEHVIVGMPHRGRLNLLVDLFELPPEVLFYKMQGNSLVPPDIHAFGDVLSHIATSVDLKCNDKSVHVSMLPNSSHLEAVNPVAVGKARARKQSRGNGQDDKILCILCHGDAAFPGQGIVAETLNMAQLPQYSVGGSLHIIVNNQLGFTTLAEMGRSTQYASDLAKFIGIPIFHVNGDYPEEVVRACQLAIKYRTLFKRDVMIDMICYRQWGHNELDDPSLTQPLMYNRISSRQSVPNLYAQEIATAGLVSEEEMKQKEKEYSDCLNRALSSTGQFQPQETPCRNHWSSMVQPSKNATVWDTGYPIDALKLIGVKSVNHETLSLHPRLLKSHVEPRLKQIENGSSIDWATAEALAIGSLLHQGFNVRISGQDVGRGTFSHRHATFIDHSTNESYVPLNNLVPKQKGFLEVANSPLSEEAVLGFEYGMSIESPMNLVIWEAQFGDFFNGAQIPIDAFVSSGETKWLLQSGLVMLLPHGMDGAGPEHSSCRIERFLQLCDSDEDALDGDRVNMCVANPTTPAQYFHLLRRQMIRNFRKPLVVASPKLILRSPLATSSLMDFAPGSTFQTVIGDSVPSKTVKKVIFCSGKHFYALNEFRQEKDISDTAIVRLESICPFPSEELKKELAKYETGTEFVWSQEEHQNMGPWSFVYRRFQRQLNVNLMYAGRAPLAAPAVGDAKTHRKEHEQVLQTTFL